MCEVRTLNFSLRQRPRLIRTAKTISNKTDRKATPPPRFRRQNGPWRYCGLNSLGQLLSLKAADMISSVIYRHVITHHSLYIYINIQIRTDIPGRRIILRNHWLIWSWCHPDVTHSLNKRRNNSATAKTGHCTHRSNSPIVNQIDNASLPKWRLQRVRLFQLNVIISISFTATEPVWHY